MSYIEVIKDVEKERNTYLGISELDKIKKNEIKEQTIKKYQRRFRLVLKLKLNGKNKITAINAWAVPAYRHETGILQWKMWTGNQGKKLHRMEHYSRRAIWTDCT